jgi:hypothetical protein
VSARERVEAAIQAAGREVVGLPELQQVATLLDAGFAAMAAEVDRLHDADFDDAMTALRDVVRLLDGPQSERAQEAQDVAKVALRRLDGESS